MQRLRHFFRILAYVHIGVGPVLLLVLLLSPPWVIGEGRVSEALRHLEDVDWRWWALGLVLVLWGLPIVAVAGWLQARSAGLETNLLDVPDEDTP